MPGPVTPTAAVVVLAAGSGSRVGAEVNKVLLTLGDLPVVGWSVQTALAVPGVGPVVLVCRGDEQDAVSRVVTPLLGDRELLLVEGGATRHVSEYAALRVLRRRIESGEVDVVAIHDGARPLAPVSLFTRTIATARRHGGAVPTVELPGLVPSGRRTSLPDRLVGVQTPQAFRAAPLLAAYDAADGDGFEGTDTAACVATYRDTDVRIRAVPTGPGNLKVTWPGDVATARALLGGSERGEDAQVLG